MMGRIITDSSRDFVMRIVFIFENVN